MASTLPYNHCCTRPHLSSMNAMSLKLNNFNASLVSKNQGSRTCYGFSFFRLNMISQKTRPMLVSAMDMTAGGSEEPKKLDLGNVLDKARKLWDSAPEPVKSFPWNRALDNFIQLILDLVLNVVKYLYVPVIAVTSVSELSYCAHERKLYIVLLPLLLGAAVAGVLKKAALESSPSLKNAEVPWHLLAIAIFFTLLKLPGPYYPYWGRILIPHFANGVLLRTLWFAILWSRRPRNSSETTSSNYEVGSLEQDKL